MSASVELIGFKEVDRMLSEIGENFTKRLIRKTIADRGRPLLKELKGNYRGLSRRGASSTGVARKLARDVGNVNSRDQFGNVGIDYKMRGIVGKWAYGMAAIFEYGSAARKPKKGEYLIFSSSDGNIVKVKSAGPVGPQAPFRRAWDMWKGRISQGIRTTFLRNLTRFMEKRLARTKFLR